MGIELTKHLFTLHARDLTASELTVMGYMCLVALDTENGRGQQPRIYFGGREALGVALGYDEWTDAANTKVKRAIQGLRRRGLITPLLEHARAGTRQSYRIEIGYKRGSESDPLRGSEIDPQEGVGIGPERGSESDPPRTYTGRGEDLPQDICDPLSAHVQTARAAIRKSTQAIDHTHTDVQGSARPANQRSTA